MNARFTFINRGMIFIETNITFFYYRKHNRAKNYISIFFFYFKNLYLLYINPGALQHVFVATYHHENDS